MKGLSDRIGQSIGASSGAPIAAHIATSKTDPTAATSQ
jgi:hypothetical protein